jgi:hypothetical protein
MFICFLVEELHLDVWKFKIFSDAKILVLEE